MQWRLLLACKVTDIFDLFLEKFDFLDCPHCGAKASIAPSLAGYFTVEDSLLVLNRGYDPEPAAREALAPLVAALDAALVPVQAPDLATFKASFATKLKAVAQVYPYSQFNPFPFEENVANWRGLQGEVLSAMLAAAYGAVPKFGLHASQSDGKIEDQEHTVNIILDLIFHLLTGWSVALPAITVTVTLEEALLRLVDSCGSASFIADRLVEMLASNRKVIIRDDVDRWIRFHFLSVEATVLAMLGRDNPHAGEWALEYLRVRCAAQHADSDLNRDRFVLSPKRIAATISYEHAWDAVATVLHSTMQIKNETRREEELRSLDAATEDMGHSGLYLAVFGGGMRIRANTATRDSDETDPNIEITPELLAESVLSWRDDFSGLPISRMLGLWQLSWFSNEDAVARLFDLLEPSTIRSPEERADLLSWFGERMKLLGAPTLALARIGRNSAPWEDDLSISARRRLWTERSNALRLAGERVRALEVALATLPLALDDADTSDGDIATAWTNCGILLRENGRFLEAEKALLQAIKASPDSQRWRALQSIAVTYILMARMSEAAEALELARQTVAGVDNQDMRISMLVTEIAVRMGLGQRERADALLRKCPAPEVMPDAGLVGFGTVLQMLAARTGEQDAHRTAAVAIVGRLTEVVEGFEKIGNLLQAQIACHSAASLAQAFNLPEAEALWLRDAEISVRAGRLPDASTAIELAIVGVREDPASFDRLVAIIPSAIAQQASGVSLMAATMELLSPLDDCFERLTTLAYEQGLGPSSVQILAELRRNAHGKARKSIQGELHPQGSGVAAAKAMEPTDSPFIVLEWCDVEDESMLGLVTYIAPNNAEIGFLQGIPNLDLVGTARQIGTRLDNWRISRPGEPHMVPQWEITRQWLRTVAGTLLPMGGHVVVIDHPALVGFPFHIALAPEWGVSYAADWLAIGSAIRANNSAPSPPRLGVLHAPRSNETKAVRKALAASTECVRELADARGLDCAIAEPGDADAGALLGLLAAVDVLKVLCHGQVSKDEHEVVLMIDHDGLPPPGYSFGALLHTTRAHRFGREQLDEVRAAPRTVFFGACSSGIVSVAGLDERTSFAHLLGNAGTKAVVAPRWKIDAELALPVLDDAMNRFLDGVRLVDAISQAACAAVARGVPSWQANAFVVEGAWE